MNEEKKVDDDIYRNRRLSLFFVLASLKIYRGLIKNNKLNIITTMIQYASIEIRVKNSNYTYLLLVERKHNDYIITRRERARLLAKKVNQIKNTY